MGLSALQLWVFMGGERHELLVYHILGLQGNMLLKQCTCPMFFCALVAFKHLKNK